MQRILLSTLLNSIVLLGLLVGGAMAETEAKRIAILPFDAVDAGKYSQLKDGLKSMLSGRLAAREELELVEADLSEKEQQIIAGAAQPSRKAIFTRLDADYIAQGRMVHSAETLRLIVALYSGEALAPQEVQVEAEGDHQILPAMDLLVLKIGNEILGKAKDASPTGSVAGRKGIEQFQTEHPDRKYKEEIISGSSVSSGGGMVIARGDLLRRRSAIEGKIISMTAGDVDGDGIEEIFVVTPHELRVYHYTKGLLEQLDAYDFPASLEVHAVNLADLEEDGNPEIYLSAVADNRFSSLIMTWSPEQKFQVVNSVIRYGIRPIQLPDGSWQLVGQAKSMTGEQFLRPGVYAMELDEDNEFSLGKRMFLPDGVNLFDFLIVDLDEDGFPEKVVVDSNLKLNVYNSSNDLLWQSEGDFAGGVNYLGSRFEEDSTQPSGYIGAGDENLDGIAEGWLNYLPVRLMARDGNNDGQVDIIAAGNQLTTFKFLKNLRSFETGKVVCLSWTGAAMQEIWTTDTLDGHVADLYLTNEVTNPVLGSTSSEEGIGEKNNDSTSKIRLLVGQDTGGGLENFLPFAEGDDNIVIYEFAISPENTGLSGEE